MDFKRYTIKQVLKQTLYGRVSIALDQKTGQLVAIKESDVSHTRRTADGEILLESPKEEVVLLRRLNRPQLLPGEKRAVVQQLMRMMMATGNAHTAKALAAVTGPLATFASSVPTSIMRLVDSAILPDNKTGRPARVIAVLELARGGELFDIVLENGGLGGEHEPQAQRIFKQLCEAVAWSHARGVAHLDVSLENTLLDEQGNAKLADFGMARALWSEAGDEDDGDDPDGLFGSDFKRNPRSSSSSSSSSAFAKALKQQQEEKGEHKGAAAAGAGAAGSTFASKFAHLPQPRKQLGRPGKPGYMAPEVFMAGLKKEWDPVSADAWSLGVTLFMLLTGLPPWKSPMPQDSRYHALIIENRWREVLQSWRCNGKVSDAALDLILRLLHPNPSKRITAAEALLHPFLLACPLVASSPFAFPVGVPVAPAAAAPVAAPATAPTAVATTATAAVANPSPSLEKLKAAYGGGAGSPVAMDTGDD